VLSRRCCLAQELDGQERQTGKRRRVRPET